ncbi:hypothetical protein CDIK_2765 [Cucumispora dikerogammari]|nr:hypothetical protein CDIK_2765 [Cucumispora dikerogammari]
MNFEIQRILEEKKKIETKNQKLNKIYKRTEEINELNDSIAILIELAKDPVNEISSNTLSSLIFSEGNIEELKKTHVNEKRKINFFKTFVKILIFFGSIILFIKIFL